MSRAVKELLEKDLRRQYGDLDSALVVSVHGLSGIQVNALRGVLSQKNVEVHVVKNRAINRVLAGTALEPLARELTGPCAFVTGGSGTIDVAKDLLLLAKEYPGLELKYGVVSGDPEVCSIEEISKRKSRGELHGEIVMLAISPGRRIAGCLNIGGKIAGCVKAIVDRLEKGEKIEKVA
jgi:large subunit ribosomal protein L10